MASKNDLKELIECPICFNSATKGPIWTCNNGHHVCNTCKPKLVNCGSCRLPITTRGLQLERMRDLIPMTCQFPGCNIEMKSKDIKSHEETCNKAPLFNCADLRCEKKLMLKDLISHIDTCHTHITKCDLDGGYGFFEEISTSLHNSQELTWGQTRFKYNEDFFFLESLKQKDEKHWLLWLYYPGLAQDAAKYTYMIKVRNPLGEKVGSVTYSGDVISMTVDRKTIEKEGMGLTFTNYTLKQLVCDDKLHYSISISKK
jgi:E3 ubiquitin-protein ligase SIAH1